MRSETYVSCFSPVQWQWYCVQEVGGESGLQLVRGESLVPPADGAALQLEARPRPGAGHQVGGGTNQTCRRWLLCLTLFCILSNLAAMPAPVTDSCRPCPGSWPSSWSASWWRRSASTTPTAPSTPPPSTNTSTRPTTSGLLR